MRGCSRQLPKLLTELNGRLTDTAPWDSSTNSLGKRTRLLLRQPWQRRPFLMSIRPKTRT